MCLQSVIYQGKCISFKTFCGFSMIWIVLCYPFHIKFPGRHRTWIPAARTHVGRCARTRLTRRRRWILIVPAYTQLTVFVEQVVPSKMFVIICLTNWEIIIHSNYMINPLVKVNFEDALTKIKPKNSVHRHVYWIVNSYRKKNCLNDLWIRKHT